MEDKSYNWLLSEISSKKVVLKILETGICRGSKLLSWYANEGAGLVSEKPLKENTRTKFLLNFFLSQRLPILEEYNPDKVICYLYHRKGRKIVTAKDAVELAENQLHGLQVRSIHMALPSSVNYSVVYRVSAWNENNELQSEVTYGKFTKDTTEPVKDAVLSDKALTLTLYLSEFILKHYLKFIKSLKMDLMADSAGQLHVLKIRELMLSENNINPNFVSRGLARSGTLKAFEPSSEEVSMEDNEYDKPPIKVLFEKDPKKKENGSKLQLRKSAPQNSTVFLEMLAKTFDRERKSRENQEIITNKRKALENIDLVDKRKLFQLSSLKTNRNILPKKNGFSSINDLLYYVEKTRPRIWVKDHHGHEDMGTLPKNLHEPSSALVSPEEKLALHKKVSSSNISLNSHRNLYQIKLLKLLNEEEQRLRIKNTESLSNLRTPSHSGRRVSIRKLPASSQNIRVKNSGFSSPIVVFK